MMSTWKKDVDDSPILHVTFSEEWLKFHENIVECRIKIMTIVRKWNSLEKCRNLIKNLIKTPWLDTSKNDSSLNAVKNYSILTEQNDYIQCTAVGEMYPCVILIDNIICK